MKYNATISGSFHKFLKEIKQIIEEFEENNINVLSPKLSNIKSTENKFIMFEHNKKKPPKEIEINHFKSIQQSDFLYVVNPQGYIGNSCAMEIGFALANNIPVFTYEHPTEFIFSLFTQTESSIKNIKTNIQKLQNEMSSFFKKKLTLFMLQKYVKKFVNEKGFEDEGLNEVVLLLMEEIGELVKAVRQEIGLKIKDDKTKFKNIEEELSDCFIYLLDIANLTNIDLEKAFLNKMKINKSDKWFTLKEIRNKINHQFNILNLEEKTSEDELYSIKNLLRLIHSLFDFKPQNEYLIEILEKLEKLYIKSKNKEFHTQILYIMSFNLWKDYNSCINRIKQFFDNFLLQDTFKFQELTVQSDNEKYHHILQIYQNVHPEKISELILSLIKTWSEYAFNKYYMYINYSLLKEQIDQIDLELIRMRRQIKLENQPRIEKIRKQISIYM